MVKWEYLEVDYNNVFAEEVPHEIVGIKDSQGATHSDIGYMINYYGSIGWEPFQIGKYSVHFKRPVLKD